MNVVFVCQFDPWRLNAGALIRNYWMVRALAREHRVHLVTADASGDAVPEDFANVCASISRFPPPGGTLGRARRALAALRPGSSYFTSGSVTAAMRRAVAQLLTLPGTVAMFDLGLLDAIPRGVPLVFNAHNTEHELLRRRAAFEREPIRTLLRIEAMRTRILEARVVRRAVLTAACSPEDRDELARLEPSAREKILVVPNGVDVARYASVAGSVPTSRTILVTGSFDWQPNVLGLRWFVDEVLPVLRERIPNVDVRVAGRMTDALARSLDRLEGVTAVARPDDMRAELARARIVVAPILPSSGTRLRILEAWAAGRPVATTPSGALGLRYADGDDLLVAANSRDLANSATRLLDDEALWSRLRARGLERARDYDWAAIGERFMRDATPALDALVRRT